MKSEFVKLALTVGWKYAMESFADKVSRTQLELWRQGFQANGGY